MQITTIIVKKTTGSDQERTARRVLPKMTFPFFFFYFTLKKNSRTEMNKNIREALSGIERERERDREKSGKFFNEN